MHTSCGSVSFAGPSHGWTCSRAAPRLVVEFAEWINETSGRVRFRSAPTMRNGNEPEELGHLALPPRAGELCRGGAATVRLGLCRCGFPLDWLPAIAGRLPGPAPQ